MAERPDSICVDDLLARGELHLAAAVLQASGDLPRARELFESVGDFNKAAEIARAQGDALAELRLRLRCDPSPRRQALLQAMQRADRPTQEQAALLCERERAWSESATLRLALQDHDGALRLFQRAGDHLGVAQIEEQRGQVRAAIAAYRAALQAREAGPASSNDRLFSQPRWTVHRRCAGLLLRVGQAEEAIPHLQNARRMLQQDSVSSSRAELAQVEAELMECFLALDERGLAERLFAQHLAWWEPAKKAASVIDYLRLRAQAQGGSRTGPDALVLGRYRLGRFLGSGSVGRVYEAEDLFTGQRVALKLLALAAASSSRAAALYDRFCHEAALLSALRHPKLVQVESFHASAGVLALEFMEGGAVSDGALPLSLATLRRLLLDVLDALMCMHASAVLHRDVKPHNIFFDRFGGAKLGDFGIASLRDLGVTQTEGLVGTLAYMSPEQIRGGSLTIATDVYGLGVTAFQLATGRLPFPGPDLLAQHIDSPPPDARWLCPQLPEAWAVLLQRLLAKQPEQRCSGLETLRAEVARLPQGPLDAQVAGAPSSSSSDAAAAAGAESDAAADPLESPPTETPVARTDHSEIFIALDARAGRTVLLERFAAGLLQSEKGAAHLAWLRRMAALAGPGLQRIYHLHLDPAPSPPRVAARSSLLPHGEGPAAEVVFQFFDPAATIDAAALLPEEAAPMSRVLRRLRDAGVVHGSPGRALVRSTGHVALLLCGHGPLSGSGELFDPDAEPERSVERLDG